MNEAWKKIGLFLLFSIPFIFINAAIYKLVNQYYNDDFLNAVILGFINLGFIVVGFLIGINQYRKLT